MILLEQIEAELLMSNLFSTVKRFSEKYISPIVLRQLYRQYCKWRNLVKHRNGWWLSRRDERRIYAFDSCLVHYLLERCFWIRYGDNEVVTDLLRILFELDGHLGKIFDFQALSTNHRNLRGRTRDNGSGERVDSATLEDYNFGSTWKMESLTSETIKPIDYFIEHAYKKRTLFNNRRFADQCILQSIKRIPCRHSIVSLFHPPCAMAFRFPEILPKLLRHGLFVRAGPQNENVSKLITGIIGIYASSGYEKCPPQVVGMGNVLLRAVKSVDATMLMKCQRVRNRSPSVQKVLAKVIEKNILPKLQVRCTGPQELKHLCRCSIRKSLYKNWQLPNGIYFLPLPTLMKRYINLELD
ncbi:SOCS box domain-containing protein [Nephila pilipes]|uniref:SOCS box domain-containing protein n=1 Tax=Nephila pilipes TaxID=299642 RepID=A0A8X6JI19_NEPPI|nr:SOCS box domain-containing protein [Nephila pilipes]